jgi:hypothetical protein
MSLKGKKKNSSASRNIERKPHISQSRQQTSDRKELKHMMKSLFKQVGTMINLTTVFTKLK